MADDLTGALEVGGKFAAAGIASQVRTFANLTTSDLRDAPGALVVDTETRHASAIDAAGRVRALARAADQAGFSQIYKKTDSTLRGNIGAELAALMDALAGAPLLYVPAYPEMGRTVKGGSLYVDGFPVNATRFAIDPFNPVTQSHIPTILATQCRRPIRSVPITDLAPIEPGHITICDGEADSDVEAAAKFYADSANLRLSAGPAAFAACLARFVDIPRGQAPALPCLKTALIVNGSLHPVSRQQIETAWKTGFKPFESDSFRTLAPSEGWTILKHGDGNGEATLDFARKLATTVVESLTQISFDALVVFGGDTAYAIVDALGNPPLLSLGEVMSGIPVCRIEAKRLSPNAGHRDRDLYLVTKAGSFGPPDVLSAMRKSLG